MLAWWHRWDCATPHPAAGADYCEDKGTPTRNLPGRRALLLVTTLSVVGPTAGTACQGPATHPLPVARLTDRSPEDWARLLLDLLPAVQALSRQDPRSRAPGDQGLAHRSGAGGRAHAQQRGGLVGLCGPRGWGICRGFRAHHPRQ